MNWDDINDLTSLDLEDNQLVGSIPSELGNLSHLTSLNLGGNQLTGVIPVELGDINDLGDNQLEDIPVNWGDIQLVHRWTFDSVGTGEPFEPHVIEPGR